MLLESYLADLGMGPRAASPHPRPRQSVSIFVTIVTHVNMSILGVFGFVFVQGVEWKLGEGGGFRGWLCAGSATHDTARCMHAISSAITEQEQEQESSERGQGGGGGGGEEWGG